ncbi:uncharacterized protein LOC116301815 [Actinia tenebrosa]|uniref:Uncharacterized protein LOC116301815 n=1 Tax=Actinia tenebrosa TaxID=6105 RepID=A0A6P8IIW1_ACTTE|nr:uncharacterized protein LOC116301815 [Actinia tenebrosa]
MPLAWSFTAIIGAFVLGETVRFLLKKIIPRRSPHHHYVGELISSFEFSAGVFEIAVIGKYYSNLLGFIFSFTFLFLKNSEYILDRKAANPCGLLEGIVRRDVRRSWVVDFVTKVSSQLTGALLAFPFMKLVWQSTASEIHFKQLSRGLSSSLEVSVLVGFSIEITATFVLTMIDFLTRGGLRKFNPLVRAGACVLICYALTGTTGVWMNPVFATVHTFLFTDAKEDILEHFFVFWIAPIFGTLIAIAIDSKLHEPERKSPAIAKTILKKRKKHAVSNEAASQNGKVTNGKANGVSVSNTKARQRKTNYGAAKK